MQASWIDADELRALAAGLQDPVKESHDEVWALEPLLDDEFIAEVTPALSPSTPPAPIAITPVCEPTVELQTLHEQLRIIRKEAQAAGLLSVVNEEPSINDATTFAETSFTQEPGLTEISERLRNFQQFVRELTSCKELLLMNKEGDLLWGTSQHYDIMATIMIAMRYHTPSAFESTHFDLTNLNDTLMVLSTPTCHGQVFLALINAVNTDESNLQKINRAMVAAIEG